MKAVRYSIILIGLFVILSPSVLGVAEDIFTEFFHAIDWSDCEIDYIPVTRQAQLRGVEDEPVAVFGIAGSGLDEGQIGSDVYLFRLPEENEFVYVRELIQQPVMGRHYIVYGTLEDDREWGYIVNSFARDSLIEENGTVERQTDVGDSSCTGGGRVTEQPPQPPDPRADAISRLSSRGYSRGDAESYVDEAIAELGDDASTSALVGWVNEKYPPPTTRGAEPTGGGNIFGMLAWWQWLLVGIAAIALIAGLILLFAKPKPPEPTIIIPPSQSAAPSSSTSTRTAVMAPPKTTITWGKLKVLSGPSKGPFHLTQSPVVTIGRESSCTITLDDQTVSSNHAKIQDVGMGKLVFIDESTNGSKVNGKLVHNKRVDLPTNAKITIGPFEFQLEDIRVPSGGSVAGATGGAATQMMGAPGTGAQADAQKTMQFVGYEFVVVSDGDLKGKRYPLNGYDVKIGRSSDQDVNIDNKFVSRSHARLKQVDGKWQLENVSSSAQGTKLNGQKVEGTMTVKPGDKITVGEIDLEFKKV